MSKENMVLIASVVLNFILAIAFYVHWRTSIKTRAAIEHAAAIKTDFFATMSHEIRTSLNGLLGMSHLLINSELNSEQSVWAKIVYKTGETLQQIINDILDFSKMEGGHLTLTPTAFDLNARITEIMDTFALHSYEKNIELLVRVAPHTPRYLIGDELRLKQILSNLVSNAMKFTSAGYILVDIAGSLDAANDVQLHIRVEDTGIGMGQDKLELIFQKYTQADAMIASQYGGTGLGLAISRQLVVLMGGELHVTSMPNQGTVFSFDITLPLAPDIFPYPDLEKVHDTNILIVCRSERQRLIMHEALQATPLHGHFYSTINDILPQLRRASTQKIYFDFVYIDDSSPQQKIFDIIDKIKIFPEFNKLMFLTSAVPGSTRAIQIMNQSKFSALLTKPLIMDYFLQTCSLLLQMPKNGKKIQLITNDTLTQQMQPTQDDTSTPSTFPGSHILLVEDAEFNQLLMQKILKSYQCNVSIASNGSEALALIDQSDYDLVFMDCRMPVMDGYEATKNIRRKEMSSGKHLTIVALTADALSGDKERCLQTGMDDYLHKPVQPEDVISILNKWLLRN